MLKIEMTKIKMIKITIKTKDIIKMTKIKMITVTPVLLVLARRDWRGKAGRGSWCFDKYEI